MTTLADVQAKLLAAQNCHPNAVQTLIGEALDAIDLIARKPPQIDALDTVVGCFAAAESEGLYAALSGTTDERLKDLVERRLMQALYAAQNAR